jgi:quercetin dioxygenase-like cupin family protein
MKALFVKYDEIPAVERRKGIHVKPFVVDKLAATIVTWDKGAEFGPEKHVDEQIDFFLKGKMEWTVKDDSGERKEIVTEGMAIGLEPHVTHAGRALEESVAVEIFYPSDRHRELAQKLGLIVSEAK